MPDQHDAASIHLRQRLRIPDGRKHIARGLLAGSEVIGSRHDPASSSSTPPVAPYPRRIGTITAKPCCTNVRICGNAR
ncbi:hypothetical protein C7S15_8584 [Burkholderia cepacia]|nr:hypothetical protein [Burkholderia cepacia]